MSIPDRSDWLDYLNGHDYLLPPAEAVTAVDQYVHLRDASPETLAAFSRCFSAYLLLASIEVEAEYKQILRDAGVTAGMRVLDVGCGSGINGHFLLDLGAAEVVGIDVSDETLALARQLPTPPSYQNRLHFQAHNINEPLPFDGRSFDLVLVANGEIPMYRLAVLAEYRRVLRPGGRIIFTMTETRKRYAWNSLIDQLMGYAFYLNLKEYWGADAFTNAAREGYDATYQQARAHFGMRFGSVPVDRVYPVTAVCEQAIQQHFALITGPIFKKQIGPGPEWETLCRLHNPALPEYMFRRPDLYIADVIEAGTAVIEKEV